MMNCGINSQSLERYFFRNSASLILNSSFIIHNYIKGGSFLDFYKSYKKPLKAYCFII